MKKIITAAVCIAMLLSSMVTVLSSCGKKEDERETKYNEALSLIDSKDYEGAYDILNTLGDYKDTEKFLSRFYTFLVEAEREREGETKSITVEFNGDNLPVKITARRYDGEMTIYEYAFDETGNKALHSK